MSPAAGRPEAGGPAAGRPEAGRAEAGGADRPRPVLSVVVLSWNTRDLTLACMRALVADAEAARYPRELVVIDNASDDGSADRLEAAVAAGELPGVRLVRNAENVGYAAGHNQGGRVATGDYLCTLNSDTEVRPGALDLLVDWLEQHPEYGAVGPRLVYPDGRIQTACMRFPGLWTGLVYDNALSRSWPGSWIDRRYRMADFDHRSSRDVDQPPGTCTVMRRAEFVGMGGFDEDLWLFFNDVDLCKRIRDRGQRIRYLAEAEVMHHEGASTKSFSSFVVTWHRNRFAYYRKHHGALGVAVLRFAVWLRAREERRRILERTRDDPERRRHELDHLSCVLREIHA